MALTSQIYITGLPPTAAEHDIAAHFGTIGAIKVDRRTGDAKVLLYRDRGGALKGDASVIYEEIPSAQSAVDWFDGKEFMGALLRVELAHVQGFGGGGAAGGSAAAPPPPAAAPLPPEVFAVSPTAPLGRGRGMRATGDDPAGEALPGGGPPPPATALDGDWPCPRPGCGNVNFRWRTECNRCGEAMPADVAAAVAASGGAGRGRGRGRGRGGPASAGVPGTAGFDVTKAGPPGRFKPGDWACSSCMNINWGKRDTCNVCNAPKGGVVKEARTGRGGGFNERQDASERKAREGSDSDEFDDLGRKKKKYRAKCGG